MPLTCFEQSSCLDATVRTNHFTSFDHWFTILTLLKRVVHSRITWQNGYNCLKTTEWFCLVCDPVSSVAEFFPCYSVCKILDTVLPQ